MELSRLQVRAKYGEWLMSKCQLVVSFAEFAIREIAIEPVPFGFLQANIQRGGQTAWK